MCRYDEEYDWYVDSTDHEAVSAKVERCEDCGRLIEAGEIHTVFTAMENEDEADDRYATFAQEPQHCRTLPSRTYGSRTWFDPTEPYHRIDTIEDDIDNWTALGFEVFEDEDNPDYQPEIEHHVSCAQCVIANRWLIAICDQHNVLCTVSDLESHTDEYDAATLGPDFMHLHKWSRTGWVTPPGGLYHPDLVAIVVGRAIAHAIAAGLQEAH